MMNLKREPITDNWYVSNLNFIDEAVNQYAFAPNITLSDCTLRDGEQQPGVAFTKDDKIAIAKQLDKLGIDDIEVGMPVVSREDAEATRDIVALGLKAKISAFCRGMKEDVDLAASLGVWGIRLSLPIGVLQRKYKLNWTDEKYISTCLSMTEYAKKKGLHITFSPFDTTRAEDLGLLDLVLTKLRENGFIDKVRLVDTVGAANPSAIRYLVRRMKASLKDIPIEIHCHDDFGLAVANTLAALESGADVISSTINGIGERAGNAPTEEIAVALKVLYGIDIGINLSLLKETSELVERLSGVRLQPHKAIVGDNCCAHESGLTVAGMAKMRFTSEPYAPELVGQRFRIVLGKSSGKMSIELKLKEHGLQCSDEATNAILQKVKVFSLENKRAVTDEEFLQMAKGVVKS
jgi:isopropylmalate/homocitrate/citramalate synthase